MHVIVIVVKIVLRPFVCSLGWNPLFLAYQYGVGFEISITLSLGHSLATLYILKPKSCISHGLSVVVISARQVCIICDACN
jgi:hypothetical protein